MAHQVNSYVLTKRRRAGVLVVALLFVAAALASSARAATVGLGTAKSFAVLAHTTVTNTGPSVISGDLGVSTGTAVTGFPPGTVKDGTIQANTGLAAGALLDLKTAYNDAAGRKSTATISSKELGGLKLVPGVYTSASTLGLTGVLTLNGEGKSNAVFIFQVGSELTAASGSRVSLIGGAKPCNVFWQVASLAAIGTTSRFVGTIMALDSVTLATGATLDGRALARTGDVTLDDNTITKATCAKSSTKHHKAKHHKAKHHKAKHKATHKPTSPPFTG